MAVPDWGRSFVPRRRVSAATGTGRSASASNRACNRSAEEAHIEPGTKKVMTEKIRRDELRPAARAEGGRPAGGASA